MADSINYQLAHFVASYGAVSQIPESTAPEVSFVGRSNVGKSSIMNKLFGRKGLVKVSSTPGKTANINFFEADGVHFIDLPGYGFARRSKTERERWARLIGDFFESDRSFNLVVSLVDIRHDPSALDHQMIEYLRENEFSFIVCLTKAERERWARLIGDFFESERSFNLVVSLVDIRHDPSALDHQMIEYLRENEFSFIVCLTKADKLSRPKRVQQAAAIRKQLNVPAEDIIVTSAEDGTGTAELKRVIAERCL